MASLESVRGPALDRPGERAYFADGNGVCWRVYDVGLGPRARTR